MAKVLITDKINDLAVKIVQRVAEVDNLPTMDEDKLCEIIGEYDALLVRSQTKVTAKIIEAGKNLKIIGRAGVGVDNMIRLLIERNLIKEVGRKDAPGRPTQFGTTKEFLKLFRLNSIAELPKLDENEEERFELAR